MMRPQVGRGRAARQCDIAAMGHGCDKSDHLLYRLVQVDMSHFKRCFLQHTAQPAYHFAGALIVTPDVNENFPQFIEIW